MNRAFALGVEKKKKIGTVDNAATTHPSQMRGRLGLTITLLAAAWKGACCNEAYGSDDGKRIKQDRVGNFSGFAGVAWAGYYAGVEAQARHEWNTVIWPRIQDANFNSVLEISPGGGRWAEILRHMCHRYVGVDLNAGAIEVLRNVRFPNASNTHFFANDGKSLPMVSDHSVTFAFTYDSMVHFPPTSVAAYAAELARVLRPGGTAFLHHANLPLCTGPSRVRGYYGGNKSCGIAVHARKNPQARNAGTTCESVAKHATDNGLRVLKQERYPWGRGKLQILDCFSTLAKPHGKEGGGKSKYPRGQVVSQRDRQRA